MASSNAYRGLASTLVLQALSGLSAEGGGVAWLTQHEVGARGKLSFGFGGQVEHCGKYCWLLLAYSGQARGSLVAASSIVETAKFAAGMHVVEFACRCVEQSR